MFHQYDNLNLTVLYMQLPPQPPSQQSKSHLSETEARQSEQIHHHIIRYFLPLLLAPELLHPLYTIELDMRWSRDRQARHAAGSSSSTIPIDFVGLGIITYSALERSRFLNHESDLR